MDPKISIVITKDGWTETLNVNGKEYTKSFSRTSAGIRTNHIEWGDDPTVPEMAYPAFNDLSAGCQEAMYVLQAHDQPALDKQHVEVSNQDNR